LLPGPVLNACQHPLAELIRLAPALKVLLGPVYALLEFLVSDLFPVDLPHMVGLLLLTLQERTVTPEQVA
jgi:hypothetical protein